MKKRKRNNTITVKADRALKFGVHEFFNMSNELMYQNRNFGKLAIDKDKITYLKKSVIHWIFFNKKTKGLSISCDVDLDKLDRFVQKCKKDREQYRKHKNKGMRRGCFIRNLNAELGFFFSVR